MSKSALYRRIEEDAKKKRAEERGQEAQSASVPHYSTEERLRRMSNILGNTPNDVSLAPKRPQKRPITEMQSARDAVQTIIGRSATQKQDEANGYAAKRAEEAQRQLSKLANERESRTARLDEDGNFLGYDQNLTNQYLSEVDYWKAQLTEAQKAQKTAKKSAQDDRNNALKEYYATRYMDGSTKSLEESDQYDAYLDAQRRLDSARGRVSSHVGAEDMDIKAEAIRQYMANADGYGQYYGGEALKQLAEDKKSYRQNGVQRAGKAVAAGAEQVAGGFVGVGRYALEGMYGLSDALNRATGNDPANAREAVKAARAQDERTMKGIDDTANSLLDKSSANLRSASLGASKFEELAQQGIASGVGMAGDALVGFVTGGAINPLTSMGLRVFGQSAQEAKRSGAALWQQGAYGLANAAVEVGTEMMGGIGDLYGKGGIDRFVENWIGQVSRNPTMRLGLTMLSGAISEGGEEVVSDLLNPFVEGILQKGNYLKNVGRNFTSKDWSETLDSFLVGSMMGLTGAGVNIKSAAIRARNAQYVADARKAAASQGANFDNMVIEAGMKMSADGEAHAAAEELKSRLDRGQRLTDDELANSVALTMLEDEAQNAEIDKGADLKAADELGQRYVERAIKRLGVDEESAKALQSGFGTSDIDAKTYADGITEMVENGMYGITFEQAQQLSDAAKTLTDSQFENAFRIGQITREIWERNNAAEQVTPDSAAVTENITEVKNNHVEQQEERGIPQQQAAEGIQSGAGRAERLDRVAADGQSGVVAEGAGAAAQGRSRSAQAEVAARIRAAAQARGDLRSTRSLGLANGTAKGSFYIVNGTDGFTPEMSDFAVRWGRQGDGYKCVFISGNLEFERDDGTTFEARGTISPDGKVIYVRADHETVSWEQIAKHEQYHAAVKKDPALNQKIKESLKAKYGNGWAIYLKAAYADKYFTRKDGKITVDADYILEEIFADAYAGIDVLAGYDNVAVRATELTDEVSKGVNESEGGETVEGEQRYAIETNAKGQFVQADRQVIYGDDPELWGKQVEDYINGKIRHGQNVQLIAADGDVLTLTAETAGKAKHRYNPDGSEMNDEYYSRKLNAEAHIDELAAVSVSTGKTNTDTGGRHGAFASGGWKYRRAFFRDFDNKYYEIELSVAVGADGNVVYHIGAMKERSFPYKIGSSTNGGAQVGKTSSGVTVTQSNQKSNPQTKNNSGTQDQTQTGAFKRWFRSSKVVNADGSPKVMYHGTASTFWTFDKKKANDKTGRMMGLGAGKGKFYLTEYEASAKAAADSAASTGRGNNPHTMALYVAAMKPMDRADYDARLQRAYAKYPGSDPRADGYDYKQRDKAIAEVDKQIRKEGYDAVWDKSSGEMFVYDPTQLKSATENIGTFDRNNPDIRFSMDSPVEQTDRLVALHNKSTSGVMRMLERGGVPFPSIAIKKAGTPHEGFGDCTIVFPRATIDPERNTWNKLYSNDAWTPTEPRTEYDVADTTEIKKKFENMLGTDAYRALHGDSYLDDEQIAKDLRDSQGDIFEALKGRSAVKYGYLQSIGQRPEIPQTEKQLDGFGRYKNDQLTAIFDKIDGARIVNASYDDTALLQEIADVLNDQFTQAFGTKDPVFKKFKKNPLYTADDVRLANIQDAYRAWDDAGRTIPTVDDTYALDRSLKSNTDIEADENYKRWVESVFDGIISDSGISNGRERFTPSGNQRSFKQTHVPATLENIVQQMRKENETGIGAIGGINLRGAATKNYSNVEDMRKDSSRLLGTHITDDVYDSYMKGFHERLNDLVHTAAKEDRWQSRDSAEEIMLEAVRDCKTKRSMQTKLQKEAQWINYSDELVDDLWQLKQDVQNMPAPYFEAKPRRTVRPDEAAAFIIPDNSPAKLISMLEQKGLPYETYKAGDETDRLAKVNAVTSEESGTRFSRDTPEDSLRKQNEQLRKQVAGLKGQMKRTTVHTVREGDIAKLSTSLLKTYTSKADKAAVTKALQELGNYIVSGEELSWGELKGRALDIAKQIVDNAEVLNDDEYRNWEELRDTLRRTKIRISTRDKANIEDWGEFRRRNYGRMPKLGVSDTEANVDMIFAELAEMYPGVFDGYQYSNPADQLLFIESFLDGIEPVMENPFSYDLAMAEENVANEILDNLLSEDVRQTAPTFADKADAKLMKQKAKDAQKIKDVKAELKTQKIENEKAVKQLLKDAKKDRDDRIAALKEHYAEARRTAAERRKDSQARTRLLNHARRLMNKKLPAANRAMLNSIIGELDTVAKSMTGKTLTRLENLRDWYEERKQNDPDFISDQGIEKAIARLSKRQINDLTQEEVADLTNILLNIENELKNEHKLIDSADRRETYTLGQEVIHDVQQVNGTGNNGVVDAWDKFIVTETLSPERQIHRMTGYNEDDPLYKLTKALSDGQRVMIDYQMRAQRPFKSFAEDKEFNKHFAGKDADEIEIIGHVDGMNMAKVKITPAMRASLYLHSRNDQNLKHIAQGGITVPDIKLYKQGKIAEAYARGTTIKLTPSQVRGICASMSEEEKRFAAATSRYFNVTSKDAINATSEMLKGYSLAQVDNYFPINTDTSFTRSDFESLKMDGTIEGMGFLKDRVNASNPIMLRDANDVLEKSIQMHSKYVGLAIPVRNFNKVWNVTTGSYMSDGTRSNFENSVQKAIKAKWGESGYNYIEKMMTDLQGGGVQNKNVWIKELNKIRSKYAGAVLTLNLSVAAKQAASYPTAAAVLGWEPLIKAMGDIGNVDLELIEKYTPLQWYRSQGFSTKELGDLKTAGKQLPKVLNWVQGMDVLTTRKLWKASEYYVQQHNKALSIGSDAYYKAVAEIYNRVIEETQPNYTTMQRPQLLRSDDTLLGNLAMFKTQPFQNFNILYDAAGKLKAEMARGDETAIKEARKSFANAVTSQLGQLAVFAGMTMAWAFFRGKDDKYKDDDGEMSLGSVMSAFGKDMMGGVFSTMPFGSDAWELISSKLFGDTYYGMDTVTITAVSDTITSLSKLANVIKTVAEEAQTEDGVNWQQAWIDFDSSADKISKVTGLPYENIVNTFISCFRWAAKAAGGKYVGEFENFILTKSIENKRNDYYDLLFKAYQDGGDQYDKMLEMMRKAKFDEEAIEKAMKKRLQDAYFSDDGGDYDAAVEGMVKIAGLSEQKAKEDVDGWAFEREHGFKLSKMKEQYLSGAITAEEVQDLYEEQGLSQREIAKKLAAWDFEKEHGFAYGNLDEQYANGNVSKDEAMRILTDYGDKTKNDAENTISGWDFKNEHGFSSSETKNRYIDGKLTVPEAKKVLAEQGYDGDAITEKLSDWDFEKKNGFSYDDKKSLYQNGKLTRAALVNALISKGGMTKQEAEDQATAYDWESKYDISVSKETVSKYNVYCKASGVSEKIFLDVRTLSNNTKNDVNDKGHTIQYSAAKKIAAYINGLNLTAEQKTALAQSLWTEKTVRKVKLW